MPVIAKQQTLKLEEIMTPLEENNKTVFIFPPLIFWLKNKQLEQRSSAWLTQRSPGPLMMTTRRCEKLVPLSVTRAISSFGFSQEIL